MEWEQEQEYKKFELIFTVHVGKKKFSLSEFSFSHVNSNFFIAAEHVLKVVRQQKIKNKGFKT